MGTVHLPDNPHPLARLLGRVLFLNHTAEGESSERTDRSLCGAQFCEHFGEVIISNQATNDQESMAQPLLEIRSRTERTTGRPDARTRPSDSKAMDVVTCPISTF